MAMPRNLEEDLADVRLSQAAVNALGRLPDAQAKAVAKAIARISSGAGTPLRIQPPSMPSGSYRAVVPDNDEAPVVIYRELGRAEGGGYLVTSLTSRSDYEGYQRADRSGFLDSDAGRALISGVTSGVAGTISTGDVINPVGPIK
jgi:hypothetical protein